jgi:Zn-dependent peptidase ImmA (M78 family)
MSIEDIVFNPYVENNIEEMSNTIIRYYHETQPEIVMEKLAERVYFDNSIPWSNVLISMSKKSDFIHNIEKQFYKLIDDQKNDVVPQFTYLIVVLISCNLLKTNSLDSNTLRRITSSEAKYILFSFLAAWDLQRAVELDKEYTIMNFGHVVEANKLPIKDLILNAEIDIYYGIVQDMLTDVKVQYHFNQEIQKIVKRQVEDELQRLGVFLEKCFQDTNENVNEFARDLLELTLVQGFLSEYWDINLSEKIYKSFSRNKNKLSDESKKMSLSALNKFRSRLKSEFAVAARYQIDKLNDNDKTYIFNIVEKASTMLINDFSETITVQSRSNWEWNDYAHALLNLYKGAHDDHDVVNVYQLCSDLGIKIYECQLETGSFDACLVRDSTLVFPIIIINTTGKSQGRINFSIAHEIAHAVLPHHANKNFFCFLDDVTESNTFVMNKQLEKEANNFATYILLPDRRFKEDFEKLDFTIDNVKLLSARYGASMVLVTKKWVERSNLEIAMVFSTAVKVDWAVFSDDFPFKWINHIDVLSSVNKVITEDERGSIKQQVHSTKWFEAEYPRCRILEESFKIFDNKVLTLLQVIDEE